jgi:hypothetical protein
MFPGKRNQNSNYRAVNELEKVMNTVWVCLLTSLHVEAADCCWCLHGSYTHCHSSKQLAACAESTIPTMTPDRKSVV